MKKNTLCVHTNLRYKRNNHNENTSYKRTPYFLPRWWMHYIFNVVHNLMLLCKILKWNKIVMLSWYCCCVYIKPTDAICKKRQKNNVETPLTKGSWNVHYTFFLKKVIMRHLSVRWLALLLFMFYQLCVTTILLLHNTEGITRRKSFCQHSVFSCNFIIEEL